MVEDESQSKPQEMNDFFVPKSDSVPASGSAKDSRQKEFIDVLRMFAPGTSLRLALDDLLRARMGALIVIDNGLSSSVVERGFKIYSRFTAQRLIELAKMDGAIVLSKNAKKILYANAFLFPDQQISTRETGTRHKSAERTAKQTGAIVIAISERKNKITIYQGDKKHVLRESSEILRRATENLQILEKQRESLNEILANLNLLEIQKIVTVNDVSVVIQRFEILKKISETVKRYLVELGKEGEIVSMRLKDLMRGLEKEEAFVLKDYFGSEFHFIEELLLSFDFDFLLEPSNLSRTLFEEFTDKKISPRGIRLLSKTDILERYIDSLIGNFGTLNKILSLKDDELLKIFETEGMVSFFKQEIYNLKEKILVGKRI